MLHLFVAVRRYCTTSSELLGAQDAVREQRRHRDTRWRSDWGAAAQPLDSLSDWPDGNILFSFHILRLIMQLL